MPNTKAKPKPKMYTQAQVDKLVAQAKKDAANPVPSAKKQAAMKKKISQEKLDAKLKKAAMEVRRRSSRGR
jgi:hypothetical protein